tara:strand:- start:228 stop:548 length:321 start_codon:yes stop_codon:yes gene_type:complete
MFTTVTRAMAVEVLMADTHANWTYEEASALFDWYEELEEDIGEPIAFDYVAIRWDWSSGPIDEVLANYSNLNKDVVFDTMEDKIEWLQDLTRVIVLKNDNNLYMTF